MKGKISWLIVSSLMVLSLVATACAPAVVEEPEVTEKPKPEVVEKPKVVEPVVEKPKYGGTLRVMRGGDPGNWEQVTGHAFNVPQQVANETLWGDDWSKGPAGTGEVDMIGYHDIPAFKEGRIAESWELPTKMEGDTATLIFHIRKGVHWALNPASEASRLVGGRELTVDDVLFSLKQFIQSSPPAYGYKTNPELRDAKITSPAPWTVKIEVPWTGYSATLMRFPDTVMMVPPEVVAKYGLMNKWYLSVGTGPFYLTDYVADSSWTFKRNPNYWMKDPIGSGKGNQLPYIDELRSFVIPDFSTQLAALRTAKVDTSVGIWFSSSVNREDLELLKRTQPQLLSIPKKGKAVRNAIVLNVAAPPLNDIRVRRALMMAKDYEAIINDYFGGEAHLSMWPIHYETAYAAMHFWPTDPDVPESVRELYTYNPEKAKQLLAEAGYPQGFKITMNTPTDSEAIDYASIVKDMWRKVGVDLEIRPTESGVMTLYYRGEKPYEYILFDSNSMPIRGYAFASFHGPGILNTPRQSDPYVEEYYQRVQKAYVEDRDEAHRLIREVKMYVLDQVWAIQTVAEYSYNVWWPWVKNYRGEEITGYTSRYWMAYVWLDRELKKSLGY